MKLHHLLYTIFAFLFFVPSPSILHPNPIFPFDLISNVFQQQQQNQTGQNQTQVGGGGGQNQTQTQPQQNQTQPQQNQTQPQQNQTQQVQSSLPKPTYRGAPANLTEVNGTQSIMQGLK
ncbi:hypothetical protein HDU76_003619, partial [Blyttiomyces sp. JEL0837]